MKLRQAHKIARSPRALVWMEQFARAAETGTAFPKPIWRSSTDLRCVKRLFKWSATQARRERNDPS